MQPTTEILAKLRENSEKNHEKVFTRLFRYLLRPDLYYIAYKNLYANDGAATKGVNDDTADDFSEDKVNKLIETLKEESYRPKPVRRTYLEKSNGKMRPLGIPTFTDKLVQEAMRMILEAIYEPQFSNCSHGFRPGRSCHTALKQVKRDFTGIRWFVEGDIKGCFDSIDHSMLVKIVGKKVKDARFIKLMCAFLKAGYMENWQYHETYSGTPQGGIISPILANIYLNELDEFVEKLSADFTVSTPNRYTPEYQSVVDERKRLCKKISHNEGEQRKTATQQYRDATKRMLSLPAKLRDDKKLKYIRYADDFLIGVNGDRQDCERIKAQLSGFIGSELKMELSMDKTLITHSSNPARFLGYDVRVRRDLKVKRKGVGGPKSRTMSGKVELAIPLSEKIERFLFGHGVVEQRKDNGRMEPCKRNALLYLTDLEIVTVYNAELRGICNYYSLASNFNKLQYFGYLMEYSCLKTLANKHQSKISKVREMYKDGKGAWGIPYSTSKGNKRRYFAKYSDCKDRACSDSITHAARNHAHMTTSFESRLKARVCEVCGRTDSEKYVIHHVNKVKNLKGKQKWEQIMIAKRRKTMVVCHKCHMAIHHGEKRNKSQSRV